RLGIVFCRAVGVGLGQRHLAHVVQLGGEPHANELTTLDAEMLGEAAHHLGDSGTVAFAGGVVTFHQQQRLEGGVELGGGSQSPGEVVGVDDVGPVGA